ncbi:hypothetical protein T265_09519 [Opisthorchis viverrini]|uniref:Uncharacterized protein n=1 Tax=Opisthorchis viverrini TaxID=6198 RepID=A0A074Z5M7_OPIVI|nr:hypothetical protein T265_09519 [Opisthorchis viverrini]KER22378.1 hypothetical protein T265_09519 [Opisthorchis viverrini]
MLERYRSLRTNGVNNLDSLVVSDTSGSQSLIEMRWTKEARRDSLFGNDLEAFSPNPSDDSFAKFALQPGTFNCGSFRTKQDYQSKGQVVLQVIAVIIDDRLAVTPFWCLAAIRIPWFGPVLNEPLSAKRGKQSCQHTHTVAHPHCRQSKTTAEIAADRPGQSPVIPLTTSTEADQHVPDSSPFCSVVRGILFPKLSTSLEYVVQLPETVYLGDLTRIWVRACTRRDGLAGEPINVVDKPVCLDNCISSSELA